MDTYILSPFITGYTVGVIRCRLKQRNHSISSIRKTNLISQTQSVRTKIEREMEMSVACAAAASVSKPLCFSKQSRVKTQFLSRTKRPICVKTLNSLPARGHTLSTNWDLSNFSVSNTTSAPRLPRFEELDATNMLLRQRIIFLGSQVPVK